MTPLSLVLLLSILFFFFLFFFFFFFYNRELIVRKTWSKGIKEGETVEEVTDPGSCVASTWIYDVR